MTGGDLEQLGLDALRGLSQPQQFHESVVQETLSTSLGMHSALVPLNPLKQKILYQSFIKGSKEHFGVYPTRNFFSMSGFCASIPEVTKFLGIYFFLETQQGLEHFEFMGSYSCSGQKL